MGAFKFALGTISFVVLYCFIDWFASVTAPVLGPIVLIGFLVFLIWLLGVLYRAGK